MQVFKINMLQWYAMIIASLWVCVPDVSYAGIGREGSPHGLNRLHAQNVESGKDMGSATDNVSEGGSAQNDEETSREEPSKGEENAREASKELTPFMPSETIPAEQGVDFPYDI